MGELSVAMRLRSLAIGLSLASAVCIAIFLAVNWFLTSGIACGGQCAAPWVYTVSFPPNTPQATVTEAIARCSRLPIVTSTDPKESDMFGPHVLTSSQNPVQLHRLETCLKVGGATGISFPD